MRRLLIICLLVLAGMTSKSSLANEPVILPPDCDLHGVVPTEAERWIAVWNFDSPDGCIMYTGIPAHPDLPPPVIGYDIISCTQQDDVVLQGGAAWFNGQSFLACDFQIGSNPQEQYQDYDDFWMYALARMYFAPGATNPIVTHPDFRLAAPANTAGSHSLKWSTRRSNESYTNSISAPFIASSEDRLRTDTCAAHATTCPGGPGWVERATINGVAQVTGSSSHGVRISPQRTSLYIGFDPNTRTYFNGVIGMIIIDPGFGNGPTGDSLPPVPTPQ